jgi:hypothetical protein
VLKKVMKNRLFSRIGEDAHRGGEEADAKLEARQERVRRQVFGHRVRRLPERSLGQSRLLHLQQQHWR